jgi:hypothetical protein
MKRRRTTTATTATTSTPAPLPLFEWASRRQRIAATAPRLILRADLCDAEGEPRACLSIPGRRLPLAFPNIPAALAALARMDAAHARR